MASCTIACLIRGILYHYLFCIEDRHRDILPEGLDDQEIKTATD